MTSLIQRFKNLWRLSDYNSELGIRMAESQGITFKQSEIVLKTPSKMAQIIKKQDRNFLEELNGTEN